MEVGLSSRGGTKVCGHRAARQLAALGRESLPPCYHYHDDPNWSQPVWGRVLFEEERRVFGPDPWPNEVKGNRTNLG